MNQRMNRKMTVPCIELELVLVRHGLTKWNAERRYLGHTDLPLLAEAAEKLALLREQPELSGGFWRVGCSDLLRCRETLACLVPALASVVEYDPRLREMNFGKWEGCTYEQLKDNSYYRDWVDDPTAVAPPEGEAWSQFAARVRSVLSDLGQALEKEYINGAGSAADERNLADERLLANETQSAKNTPMASGPDAMSAPAAREPHSMSAQAAREPHSMSTPAARVLHSMSIPAASDPASSQSYAMSTPAVNEPQLTSTPAANGRTPQSHGAPVSSAVSPPHQPWPLRALIVTHGGVIREIMAQTIPGVVFRNAAAPSPGTETVLRLVWQNGQWSGAQA